VIKQKNILEETYHVLLTVGHKPSIDMMKIIKCVVKFYRNHNNNSNLIASQL